MEKSEYADVTVVVASSKLGIVTFHLDRRCIMLLVWFVLVVPITMRGVSVVKVSADMLV
jgi:hypothetical protein